MIRARLDIGFDGPPGSHAGGGTVFGHVHGERGQSQYRRGVQW
jgi:hypothetical protein